MRIAFLTDIHANRHALEACLAAADRAGAQRFVFLGDYVGYGGDPEAVLAIVRERCADGAIAVRGNHDSLASAAASDVTPDAAAAARWTWGRLSAADQAFLAGLPLTHPEDDRLYVHADASAPGRWRYVQDAEAARLSLAAANERIVMCGHTHQPALYAAGADGRVTAFTPQIDAPAPLLRHRRWHVVLGSVGQPRNRDPAAAFALYDTATAEISFRRAPYDVTAAADRIRDAGLPSALAERLFVGR